MAERKQNNPAHPPWMPLAAMAMILVLTIGILLWSPWAKNPGPTAPQDSGPGSTAKPFAGSDGIRCSNFSSFSGQFVEDGRDEPVQNVAAVLVTNNSGKFVDLATIYCTIDGKEARFVVTGLPDGDAAWVMEQNKLRVQANSKIEYTSIAAAYREDPTPATEKLSVTADAGNLIAKNNTDATLKEVIVYYKVMHSDGNYYGGITYRAAFGDIAPGQSVQTLAGHFSVDAKIVHIGWNAHSDAI